MHLLTQFLTNPYPGHRKKNGKPEADDLGKVNFTEMKKIYGFMGKVDEKVLSLSDAFVDYLNDTYYPGAIEILDTETVDYEFENFFNTYAK